MSIALKQPRLSIDYITYINCCELCILTCALNQDCQRSRLVDWKKPASLRLLIVVWINSLSLDLSKSCAEELLPTCWPIALLSVQIHSSLALARIFNKEQSYIKKPHTRQTPLLTSPLVQNLAKPRSECSSIHYKTVVKNYSSFSLLGNITLRSTHILPFALPVLSQRLSASKQLLMCEWIRLTGWRSTSRLSEISEYVN